MLNTILISVGYSNFSLILGDGSGTYDHVQPSQLGVEGVHLLTFYPLKAFAILVAL